MLCSGTSGTLILDINQLILAEYHTTTQSIEQSLTPPTSNTQIIVDEYDNCSSMEFPCVVCVCGRGHMMGDNFFYTMIARARTMLVIIDNWTLGRPTTKPTTDIITYWDVNNNGEFYKVRTNTS